MLEFSDIMHIGGLLHSELAAATETLKAVRAETDDGSDDWQAFHQRRVETAQADHAEAAARLHRYTAHFDSEMRESL